MLPWILGYLSIGLAFFAWLFVHRLERRDLPRLMDRAHLGKREGVGAWIVLAIIFAVLWPVAAPMALRAHKR